MSNNNTAFVGEELEQFVKYYETQIFDTYHSNRFWNNNVNVQKCRSIFLCFCCLNESYKSDWKFDREKNYLQGYDLRNKKYFGLTICSSYAGICKHIGSHKVSFERSSKRRINSDYNGLFVSITSCVDSMLWDSKRYEMLSKMNFTANNKPKQIPTGSESENKDHGSPHIAPCFISKESECVQMNKKKTNRCFFGKESAGSKTIKSGFETPLKKRRNPVTYDSKDDDTVVWGNEQNSKTSFFRHNNSNMVSDNLFNEMNGGLTLFNEMESHEKDVPECLPFTYVTQQE
jgi:hypothetical protein